MKTVCTLRFDSTKIVAQVEELTELLLERFPEGIPDRLLSHILGLSADVVFGNDMAAVGTDGSYKISNVLGWGSSFEDLATALRAGKLGSWHSSVATPA